MFGHIRSLYDEQRPVANALHGRVLDTLRRFCEGTPGLAVTSRVKTFDSVVEKLQLGRWSTWSEVDDIVAFTIIVPSLLEEAVVREFLLDSFEEHSFRARHSDHKQPDVFSFDSPRMVAKLRHQDLEEGSRFKGFLFEVQIKTAFEFAWSACVHSRAYKGRDVDWKTLRLAAQLKAVVEQLDTSVLAFDAIAKEIVPSSSHRTRAQMTIKSELAQILPQDLHPASWQRFSDGVLRFLEAANRTKMQRPNRAGKQLISKVKQELADEWNGEFPRSLTPMEFIVGTACKYQLVNFDEWRPGRFVIVGSESLCHHYPSAKGLGPFFGDSSHR